MLYLPKVNHNCADRIVIVDVILITSHMHKNGQERDDYYKSFKDAQGEECAVYKNPSVKEFDAMVLKLNIIYGYYWIKEIKALLFGKDMYMWHGDMLHDHMSMNLDIYGKALIPLYTQPADAEEISSVNIVYISTIMLTGHWFTIYRWADDKETILNAFKKHQNLKSVMGEFKIEIF